MIRTLLARVPKQSLLALFVPALMLQQAYAQTSAAPADNQDSEDLGVLQATLKQPVPQLAGQVIKDEQLKRQLALDIKDLVRYETGVTVVDAGRFGSSGYAIRGVDENRVAVLVDGLQQAETLSSQGFNELFAGYGNFNNTRNGVEIEHISRATIRKGGNSATTGSGALGGSVVFKTKQTDDVLANKPFHLGYKTGYATADSQHFQTATIAGRYGWLDVLAMHTRRFGNETKNFGYYDYDDKIQGKEREKADPYNKSAISTLLKVAINPSDDHKFTMTADQYDTHARGHDFSYTLKKNSKYFTEEEQELRHTNDRVKRSNFAINYENYSSTPFWDYLSVGLAKQSITLSARTDDYCDGNDKCPLVKNPLGMLYNDDNQLVGADGKPATYTNTIGAKPIGEREETVELEVEPYDKKKHDKKYKWARVKWDSLDTNKYQRPSSASCEDEYKSWDTVSDNDAAKCKMIVKTIGTPVAPMHTFSIGGKVYDLNKTDIISDDQKLRTNDSLIFSCDGINCAKKQLTAFEPKGNDIKGNKTTPIAFEVFERDGKKFAKTAKQNKSQLHAPFLIVPGKPGFTENIWTQRDLSTDTKQGNLDLRKSFAVGSVRHNVSYGGMYASTHKKMTNQTGVGAVNVKWWALHPENCAYTSDNRDRNHALCNNSDTYSFLIPITANTGALYLADKINVSDGFRIDASYRYDNIAYQPRYEAGKSAKIPDDMVTNLYVKEPAFNAFSQSKDNLAKKTANANANIAVIATPKTYRANSWSLGVDADAADWLNVQARYSKAFRAPTGEEIYFTFKHPDFSILPNKDLQAEIAYNAELGLTLHGRLGFIHASTFKTSYKNFIDLAYLGPKELSFGGSQTRNFNLYQNQNLQNAVVKGVELNSRLNVGALLLPLDGLNLSWRYTASRGRVNETTPMNAIAPRTQVFGIGYDDPKNRFGAAAYITDVAAKDAQDTYNRYYKEEEAKNSFVPWRSDKYKVLDLTGYVNMGDHVTLQAGVYNALNAKYLTWDQARSIRAFGTSNLINRQTGAGINRFYAPERNYRVALEVKF